MDTLIDLYLNSEEKEEFMGIVEPIYKSSEFIRRNTSEFYHHDDVTLSEHILEVALVTYKKSKKIKSDNYRTDLAVKIAMMHDLYTVAWQNNKNARVKHFPNKHGFRHPLESAINSIIWYPEFFKNDNDARIIIDGIIHHMFPLPVCTCENSSSVMELKNIDSFNKLDNKYKKMIIDSTNRYRIKGTRFSLCKSKYKEGRIVSKSDKKVSFSQINNIYGLLALLTGKNKNI